MSWRLFFRALWLRGGIMWVVAARYRVLPRRLPGPRFPSRWAIKSNAKRQGRADGKLGLPTAEQMRGPDRDFPAHLVYLKNTGDRFIRAILASMLNVDRGKGGRSAAISHVRQLINHASDQRSALESFERKLEVTRGNLERREQNLERDEAAFADAKKRRRSVAVWSRGLPRRVYLTLLIALAVAELPLLALAFQNFFSVAFSVIVSVGVSVAIIFGAHAAGVLLTKREAVLSPDDTAILSVILIGVLSTIIGLSIVRELYLKTNEQATGVSTGPTWVVVGVFAILNIMVFVAAVLVSKLRHSECVEEVDDAKRAIRGAKRAIKRASKNERKSRKEVGRIQDRIVLLDGLASSTAQRVRTSIEHARLEAARQKDFIEKCYALYIRENTRSQAHSAARQSRLLQPAESNAIPTFNYLPEVKDPQVEFRPFEEQVHNELLPLEKLLSHVEPVSDTLGTTTIRTTLNGRAGQAVEAPQYAS